MISKQWQLADDAAQRYQEVLVPAILGPFAKALVDWANLETDGVVVDVGCGTGAATRFAAQRIGQTGRVIGSDINPGMLRVARTLPEIWGSSIEWRQETAYQLSLDDCAADAVLCAQSLQFLDKRPVALREMYRILKTGGSVYLSLWCSIEQNPYFDALVSAVTRHINAATAAGLATAFSLSNMVEIRELLHDTGFSARETTIADIVLELPSIEDFVPRHIRATPMGAGYDAASEATQQSILDAMSKQLASYQTSAGLQIPFRSHLIRAIKPQ